MLSWLLHPVVLLSVGGALGANARYWLGWWVGRQDWSAGFPWATLAINVSGSLLLGIIAVLFLEDVPVRQRQLYLLLGSGFCGGFTTFSTFEYETLQMIQQGYWGRALTYVGVSVLAGFVCVAAAVLATRRLTE